MKVRTDFVTNSSSSSFSVTIMVEDKNDKSYRFTQSPLESDNVDIGPVNLEYDITNKIIKAKNLEELLEILKNATINGIDDDMLAGVSIKEVMEKYKDCEDLDTATLKLGSWEFPVKKIINEFEDYEDKIKQTEKEKEEFIKKIKSKNSSLDDIATVTIVESTINTGEYIECNFEDSIEYLDKTTTIDMKTKKITVEDDRDEYN